MGTKSGFGWRTILAVAAAAHVGFLVGWLSCVHIHKHRVELEGRRLSQEWLAKTVALGIVTIDRERLAELEAGSAGSAGRREGVRPCGRF